MNLVVIKKKACRCMKELGLITMYQMVKGFGRVEEALDDLALDVPDAKNQFAYYVEKAKNEGMESQVDSRCLDNASCNQPWEPPLCHSYDLLEFCKMEDLKCIRQWDQGGWSLVHWRSRHE